MIKILLKSRRTADHKTVLLQYNVSVLAISPSLLITIG